MFRFCNCSKYMKSLRGITGEQPSLLETEEFYEGDDPTLMNDDETVGEDLALIMEEDATTDEGSILLTEDDDDTTDDEDYVLTKVRRVLFENLCITIPPFFSGWFTLNVDNLLPPATKLGQGNIFRSVCQEFCPWGGHAWQGFVCMAGAHARQGVCGRGAHVWWGGMCSRGACMVGGVYMVGGVHATHTPTHTPPTPRDTVGHCAGGTHPTGMHSCLFIYSKYLEFKKNIYRNIILSNTVYRRKIVHC